MQCKLLSKATDEWKVQTLKLVIADYKETAEYWDKVFEKVNDRFCEPNLIEDEEYEALGNGFYREASGLFL